ncbi:hypothetical protein ACWCXH_35265, partial [Kitasatospora sp. NPDC001660]
MKILDAFHTVAQALQVPPALVAVVALLLTAGSLGLSMWAIRSVYRKALRWASRVASDENNAARQRVQAALSSHWTIVVGIISMSVSTFNLYQWARNHGQLPMPMAAGFVAGLDGATVGLVLEMYRRSTAEVPQEAALRIIRRMTWTLVAISASANWAEASGKGLLAQCAMASSPITAALLIELNLAASRAEARAAAGLDQEDDGVAGPIRLVVVLWRQLWTSVFTRLGLDARATGSEVERALLAQRAAEAMYSLRLFEEGEAALAGLAQDARVVRRSQKERKRLTQTAQRALTRGHVTTDIQQGLAYSRVMYVLTQAPAMSRVDYDDPAAVMTSLENMRIELSAERIEAGVRAQEAEAVRAKAEAAAAQAAEDLAAAQADTEAAKAAAARAAEAEAEARAAAAAAAADASLSVAKVAELREEVAQLQAEAEEAEAARERAAAAQQEAEAIRQQAADEAEAARQQTSVARQEAEALQKAAHEDAEKATQVLQQAETARLEVAAARQQAADEMAALDAARAQAEAARRQAEAAQRLTAEELKEAREELARLETAQVDARAVRQAALHEAEAAGRRKAELDADAQATAAARATAARELEAAVAAREAADRAQAQSKADAEAASRRLSELTVELDRLENAHAARSAAALAEEKRLEELRSLRSTAEDSATEAESRREHAVSLSRAALGLFDRLQGDAEASRPSKVFRMPEMGPDGPLWQSAGKQAGWDLYLTTMLTTGVEPERAELVAVGGVQDGRVRGWLGEFRRVLLEMVIGADVHPAADSVQDPGAAVQDPGAAVQESGA